MCFWPMAARFTLVPDNGKHSPANATNKDVIWTSSNTSVASVVNEVVTGKSVGTATIMAQTRDGAKTASRLVTVITAPAGKISNSGFENGNLEGWIIESGSSIIEDVFCSVASPTNWKRFKITIETFPIWCYYIFHREFGGVK